MVISMHKYHLAYELRWAVNLKNKTKVFHKKSFLTFIKTIAEQVVLYSDLVSSNCIQTLF